MMNKDADKKRGRSHPRGAADLQGRRRHSRQPDGVLLAKHRRNRANGIS